MHRNFTSRRASGLIIALCVLAMLAIMATTFITLMRLDVRVARNYVDDQRCEMLVNGMLGYFKAVLRDDLDRTWGRYANRTAGVGCQYYLPWPGKMLVQVGGFYDYSPWTTAVTSPDEVRGTPVSRSFWFSTPSKSNWGDIAGNIYGSNDLLAQQSFACSPLGGAVECRVGRYQAGGREYDIWVDTNYIYWDSKGRVVSSYHPDAQTKINSGGSMDQYYYDQAPFVIFSGPTYMQPGSRMTGESMLPGGTYWRWGVKVGPTQASYMNLNTAGNLDGAGAEQNATNPYNSAYLNNMDGQGLHARRAYDERASTVPSQHLGRIEWQGFPAEYEYNKVHSETTQLNPQSFPGFPAGYMNVMYAPAQVNLEKLFLAHQYPGVGTPGQAYDVFDVGAHREAARGLIMYRWGNGSGIPCNGDPRYRVGWRRDGATYYKFPSPDNPMGSDRYFGTNEVIEHDHPLNSTSTSMVANILNSWSVPGDPTKQDWFRVRPHVSMWNSDTILRGKIWPNEGRLPWLPGGGTVGDWHYMDILKRVNINMIGAKVSVEGIPGEDTALKTVWANKAGRERERLYYMLVNALTYTSTPNPQQSACQFIASLIDMVDRDQNETYVPAPDGSGAWALGVEKHPVINEVVFYSGSGANTATY